MKHRILIILIVVMIVMIIIFVMGRRGASQEHNNGDETIPETQDVQVVTEDEPEREEARDDEEPTIEEIIAEDFTLPRYGGGEITLSSYHDEKPVILDFWTTWCHNCRRDLPVQDALYEKYKEDVEVIAINMNEKRSVVDAYLAKNDFSLPIVYDDGSTTNDYYIQYTNTHVLVNKDGTIYDIFPGDIEEKHFQSLINNNQ